MKKVVNLRCPNCGSNLKINEDDKQAKCTHCESDLLIEKDMDDELKATIIDNMKRNGKLFRGVFSYIMISSIFVFIFVFIVIIIGVVATKKGIEGSNVSDFNFEFSHTSGTRWGVEISETLDDVISKNKKYKKHQITVIYNDIKSTKEDDIIKIKDKLGKFTYYEVKLDYGKDGYINKVTILDKD